MSIRKKQRGVASIEFVLGFMAFWLMCSAWVEMSYMSYVSSLGDLAISQAARESKKLDSTDFLTKFDQVLKQSDSLWARIVDSKRFQFSVRYLKSFDELTKVKDACIPAKDETKQECGIAKGAAIAVYRISYNYQPIFNLFLDADNVFSREMVVIQEYQREKFDF